MQYGAYFQSAITKTNACKGMQGNKACQRKSDAGREQKPCRCLETLVKTWAMDPLLKKRKKQGCAWSPRLRKMKSWLRWRPTVRSVPLFLAMFLFLWVTDLLQRQMAHADKSLSDATTQNLAPTLTPNLWRENAEPWEGQTEGRIRKAKDAGTFYSFSVREWCISPQFIYLRKEGDVCVMWSISGLFREHSVPDHRPYQSHS